ncbi:hypothetical protein [Sphingomonas rubra]|uniref:Uncharacterized protein n=1 Tax=Sphingomonas rubra TaxID=634430 RepID=A0A1I5RVR2_9SPHN|nr:hypothetical protein [Sphingomonas rubra]SFP62523.1 hypothetical protein SAMN04488241_104158 [Sphingomonas rubra]
MVDRSPNFPSMALGEAVDAVKRVYSAEGRAKAPRLSFVKPLGYTTMNGRSLRVLGALKAYGLIEGRGDELRISEEGFILANAPPDSSEYREALLASFRAPSAFQLFDEDDAAASAETLKWKLQKVGFQADGADRLVRVYRESRELVNATKGAYSDEEAADEEAEVPPSPAVDHFAGLFGPKRVEQPKAVPQSGGSPQELGMGQHERVLQSGMLSKTASFRVIVSGQVGVSEIDRLVRKLEMDKEILADPEPTEFDALMTDDQGD